MTDEEKKEYCWNHAQIVEGYDKDSIRKDACGAWIFKAHYGMRDSVFGWEVDHVFPVILGVMTLQETLELCNGKTMYPKEMIIRSICLQSNQKATRISKKKQAIQ